MLIGLRAGSQPPAYGQQGQQGQYGQQPQGSYAPPPGAPPPGGQRPQSGNYGQPQGQGYPPQNQPPPQQPYGGPPPPQQGHQQQAYGGGSSFSAQAIEQILRGCAQEQKIQAFYPPNSPAISQIAQRVAQTGVLDRIAAEWRLPKEIASDLVKLALLCVRYLHLVKDLIDSMHSDTILYREFDTASPSKRWLNPLTVDDSGSLAFEEGGERIEDLKLIVNRVAFAASLFDDDGMCDSCLPVSCSLLIGSQARSDL